MAKPTQPSTVDDILTELEYIPVNAETAPLGLFDKKQLKAALESYLTHKIIEELDEIIQDGALQGEWVSVEWLKQRRAKLRKENDE